MHDLNPEEETMKALTLSLTLVGLLLIGCSGSSITGPSSQSQEAGELTPARTCNPDAHPC